MSGLLWVTSLSAQEAMTSSSHQACPPEFYAVPVYPQSKLCLPFADSLPASMSYHALADTKSVEDYYITALGSANQSQQMKGRLVLSFADGQQTIIISPDGSGSQVDILVKK